MNYSWEVTTGALSMKVAELSDTAIEAIHSGAAPIPEGRDRRFYYNTIAALVEALESDALFAVRDIVQRAERAACRPTRA
jgi:hypothetical protein